VWKKIWKFRSLWEIKVRIEAEKSGSWWFGLWFRGVFGLLFRRTVEWSQRRLRVNRFLEISKKINDTNVSRLFRTTASSRVDSSFRVVRFKIHKKTNENNTWNCHRFPCSPDNFEAKHRKIQSSKSHSNQRKQEVSNAQTKLTKLNQTLNNSNYLQSTFNIHHNSIKFSKLINSTTLSKLQPKWSNRIINRNKKPKLRDNFDDYRDESCYIFSICLSPRN
jgi:hypothetical protein